MLQSLQWLGTRESRVVEQQSSRGTESYHNEEGGGTAANRAGTRQGRLMQRFISPSERQDMTGAGGQAGSSYRCSHCKDGQVVPPPRPLPTLIMEEIKNRVLGSPLPSRLVWLQTVIRERLYC